MRKTFTVFWPSILFLFQGSAEATLLNQVQINLNKICEQTLFENNQNQQQSTPQLFKSIFSQELIHLNSIECEAADQIVKRRLIRVFNHLIHKGNFEFHCETLQPSENQELEDLRKRLGKRIESKINRQTTVEESSLVRTKSARTDISQEGPAISVGTLVGSLLDQGTFEGWELDPKGRHAIIERTRNPKVNRHGETLLSVLASDPILREIPVYPVYKHPVALTPETAWLFETLPNELKGRQDGSLLGLAYTFYPNSILEVEGDEYHKNPALRNPIKFLLIKTVPTEIGLQFGIDPEKKGEIDWAESNEYRQNELFYMARDLMQDVGNQTAAREIFENCATYGLARAQYELAHLLFKGIGGPQDLELGSYFAQLAAVQGLPLLEAEPEQVEPHARNSFSLEIPPLGPADPESEPSSGQNPQFTRRYDKELLHPGEAWQSPHGLIWYDTVIHASGTSVTMNYLAAKSHCRARGLRLPTILEFFQLRRTLGGDRNTRQGYRAAILPHLADFTFWSSTPSQVDRNSIQTFSGHSGSVFSNHADLLLSVRCVEGN